VPLVGVHLSLGTQKNVAGLPCSWPGKLPAVCSRKPVVTESPGDYSPATNPLHLAIIHGLVLPHIPHLRQFHFQ
jgi:hypothetical protein